MLLQSFNLTKQGASHIKNDRECQDASESCHTENYAIAIVCDGHGGEDYVRSAVGSSLACVVAKELIITFLDENNVETLTDDYTTLLRSLEEDIISEWNKAIWAHFEDNPFTEEELVVLSEKARHKYLVDNKIGSAYGTTLIAVAITDKYWFGIHIGDGKCIAVNPEGKFLQPIPWDKKCFLNSTTSLCDSDAIDNFRHFYSEKLPYAVFVGSDGIDDCFGTTEQLKNFYKTVLYSFANEAFDTAVAELCDYLPRLSAKGSGDDVSIAAILDMDNIGNIESVKEFDAEKEKARIEENARLAALEAEEERKRVEAERAEQLRQQQELKEQQRKEQLIREQQHQEKLLKERQQKEQQCKEQQDKERKLREVQAKQHQNGYCTYCGAALTGGMQYCGRCGEKVVKGSDVRVSFSQRTASNLLDSTKKTQLEKPIVSTSEDKNISKSDKKSEEKGELSKALDGLPKNEIKDFAVNVVDEIIREMESAKSKLTNSNSSDNN